MTRYSFCAYGAYACVIAFMNYHKIDGQGFATLFVLMVFDSIFGIAKAYILRDGDAAWFSTRRLKMWVISKVSILITVILLAMVVSFVTQQERVVDITASSMLWLFIVAEFISVVQAVIAIRQGKHIEERDAISAVLNWFLCQIRTFLENKIKPEPPLDS